MNEQPEALRLADELAIQNQYDFYKVCEGAAAELRRLHQENETLRAWRDEAIMLCAKRRCAYWSSELNAADAELRRLHQENERLRDAVKAEREACAKACEAREIIDPVCEYDHHYNQGTEHCAFAIRARGEA